MSSYWNYRVMRHEYRRDDKVIAYDYKIHEVFYTDDQVHNWTEDGIDTHATVHLDMPEFNEDPIQSIRDSLNWMLAALDQPILDAETGKEIQ